MILSLFRYLEEKKVLKLLHKEKVATQNLNLKSLLIQRLAEHQQHLKVEDLIMKVNQKLLLMKKVVWLMLKLVVLVILHLKLKLDSNQQLKTVKNPLTMYSMEVEQLRHNLVQRQVKVKLKSVENSRKTLDQNL
jgi:hypothetical protein